MTDAELAHFGVKGMKWGKRKADSSSSSPKPPSKSQLIKEDREAARKEMPTRDAEYKSARRDVKATKRGSPERLAALARLNTAIDAHDRTWERTQQKTIGEDLLEVGVGLGVLVAPIALVAGGAAISSMASNRAAARGATAAANALADSRGLTSYRTISLAFDAASNTWK